MGGIGEGASGEKVGVLVGAAVSVATISVLTIAIEVSITSVGFIAGVDVRELQAASTIVRHKVMIALMIFIIVLIDGIHKIVTCYLRYCN